jgi:flagellar basal-body rod protein FlgB
MNNLVGGIFNFSDRLQMQALNQRSVRNDVIAANIANAETPGFLALGYDFEEQLSMAARSNVQTGVKVTNPLHLRNEFTQADGTMTPDVHVRPTETIPNDGNTVDLDKEMAASAENQILFRAAVELLNRKVGTIRYAITNGGR